MNKYKYSKDKGYTNITGLYYMFKKFSKKMYEVHTIYDFIVFLWRNKNQIKNYCGSF